MLDLVLTWIGIGTGYLVAAAMVVGGGYLAFVLGANPLNPLTRLFHYLGLALIAVGILIAAFNYGKANGAADCQAAWKAKNYEAQIDRLKQEAEAKKLAADTSAEQAAQLARQNDEANSKISEYQQSTEKLANDLAVCRRASGDDDRRVCDITGESAAGCEPAK